MDDSTHEDFEPSDDEMAQDLKGAISVPKVTPLPTQERIRPELQILRAAFDEDPICPDAASPRMAELMEKSMLPFNVIKFWFIKETNKKAETAPSSVVNNVPRARTTVPKEEKVNVRKNVARNSTMEPKNKESFGHGGDEKPEHLQPLFKSFCQKPYAPHAQSQRMRKLMAKTGLKESEICDWFRRQKENVPMNPQSKENVIGEDNTKLEQDLKKITKEDPPVEEKIGEEKNAGHEQTPEHLKPLFKSFRQNPNAPHTRSQRMRYLMTRTGLVSSQIRDWFRCQQEQNGSAETPTSTRSCQNKENTNRAYCIKTPGQQQALTASFAKNRMFPIRNSIRCKRLMRKTGLDFGQIRNWFECQRKKEKTCGMAATTPLGTARSRLHKTPEQRADVPIDPQVKEHAVPEDNKKLPQQLKDINKDDPPVEEKVAKDKNPTHEQIPQHLKPLFKSFRQNPNAPHTRSQRMQHLMRRTGLDRSQIRDWFRCQHEKNESTEAPTSAENYQQGESANRNYSLKTPAQQQALIASFSKNRMFPIRNSIRCKRLMKTGLEYEQIRNWFACQRKKEKICGVAATISLGIERSRLLKTPEQRAILESAFMADRQLPRKHSERMLNLCAATGLSNEKVRSWFKRRRRQSRVRIRRPVAESVEKTLRKNRSKTEPLEDQEKSKDVYPQNDEQLRNEEPVGDENRDIKTIREVRMARRSIKRESMPTELPVPSESGQPKMLKTPAQLEILQKSFKKDRHVPSAGSERMADLCAATGLDALRIRTWFRRQPGVRRRPAHFKRLQKNPEQRTVLIEAYDKDPSLPVGARMTSLQAASGLQPDTIFEWFYSRATNDRRKQRLDALKTDKETVNTDNESPKTNKAQIEMAEEGVQINTGILGKRRTRSFGIKDEGEHNDSNNEISDQIVFSSSPLRGPSDYRRFKSEAQLEMLHTALSKNRQIPETDSERLEKLCAETGLNSTQIRVWFRRQPSVRKRPVHIQKTPEQIRVLFASYEKDQSLPNGDRMDELKAATELEPSVINSWFYQRWKVERNKQVKRKSTDSNYGSVPEEEVENVENRRKRPNRKVDDIVATEEILLKLFEQDPTYPKKGEFRLAELSAATGLAPIVVQRWFNNRSKSYQPEAVEMAVDTGVDATEDTSETQETIGTDQVQLGRASPQAELRMGDMTEEEHRQEERIELGEEKNKEDRRHLEQAGEEVMHVVEENEEREEKKREEHIEKEKEAEVKRAEEIRKLDENKSVGREQTVIDCDDVSFDGVPEVTTMMSSEDSADHEEIQFVQEVNNLQIVFQGERKSFSIPSPDKKPRKCPICESTCSELAMSIVSLNEAKALDAFFGSSVAHFLSYTCAVKVCMVHIKDHKKATPEVIEL